MVAQCGTLSKELPLCGLEINTMQRFVRATLFVTAHGAADSRNEVFGLMDGCKAKIVADGEAEAKAYEEYFDWCDETATDLGFDVKIASAAKEKLEANIGKLTSDVSGSNEKIEDLIANIA